MPTAGSNALEVERVQVDVAAQRGVGGVEHLEAAVEDEPVHVIGPDAPADCVTGLEDPYVETSTGQLPGTGQTGQAGSDDDHVVAAHARPPWACRNSGGR